MKRSIATISLLPIMAFIIACEKKEPPLAGTRVSIFSMQSQGTKDGDILLDRPVHNAEWFGEGGNSRNNPGHLAGRKEFDKVWTVNIGRSIGHRMIVYPPVVMDGIIFAIDGDSTVTALDFETGEVLWENRGLAHDEPIGFGALTGAPESETTESGRIFAISSNGFTASFDSKTGAAIWKTDLKTELKSPPRICDGLMLFVSGSGELFALDANTGERKFSRRTLPDPFGFFRGSAPACVDGGAIIAFPNGEVHKISLPAGRTGWMQPIAFAGIKDINTMSDIVSNPVVSGNTVFVKAYSGRMHAIDIETGRGAWNRSDSGQTTPVISGKVMFDIDGGHTLSAMDMETGKTLWSAVLETKGTPLSPLLVNNQLLIGTTSGYLYRFDPYTGKPLDKALNLTSSMDSAPIVVNGRLLVISHGNLSMFK